MKNSRAAIGAAAGLSPPVAQLCGWALVAAVEAVVVAIRVPWPDGGLSVRALHHVYSAGHFAAVAVVAYGAARAWARFGSARAAVRLAALWAVAGAVTWLLAGSDLSGPAQRMSGGDLVAVYRIALTAAFAAVIPAAAATGTVLARPRARWLAIAVAAVGIAAGCVVYPRQYPGLHLLLAWAGATVAGASLVGVRAWTPRRSARRAGLGVLAVWGLVSIAVWPANAIVVEIFRSPGAVVAPFWARAFSDPGGGRPVRGEAAEWYVERGAFPPIPPSGERLIPEDAITVLITVDALRADVLAAGEHDAQFPTLARIRDEAVRFSEARTTGSQTVYTLTSLFAGTHFSQQYWSEYRGELWPREDPTTRFPRILSDAGARTVTFASAWWLTNSAGVVRGFDEAKHVDTPENTAYNFTLARDLIDAAIDRVERHRRGSMFMYMHFMDPHWPYDLGDEDGDAFDRYVAELGYFDDHLARLIRALEAEGLAERAVFIITADHGEAFGEHGTTKHATTLYEEQLRVPLLIRVPGLEPRTVDEPVSTIDLGPTILDLFQSITPGHYMGQSLVPYLRGESPGLTRPIIAEGRLMQALVGTGGIKVIRDLRRNTHEVYDLRTDPEELHGIEGRPVADRALGRLARFFEVHTRTEDGYEVPYRK